MQVARHDPRASQGTGRDTMLAHISPLEAALLKMLGGRGDKNPRTGLPRFDVGGDGGGWDGGEPDAPAPSPVDLAAPTPTGTPPAPDGGYDSPSPPSPSPVGLAAPTPTGTPPAPEASRGSSFINALERQMNPFNIAGFGPRLAMEGTRFGMQTLGNTLGRSINDLLGGNALAEDTRGMGDTGLGDGRSDASDIQALSQTQPVSNPAPSYMRPNEAIAPVSLGIPSGLSDIQKRALIATHGTQGVGGNFRSQEAGKYFANLLSRALIGDNNAPNASAEVLPVERSYIGQQFGKPGTGDNSSLLNELRQFWAS